MDELVYKPPNRVEPKAFEATLSVKFAQKRVILDEYYVMGGTRWSRFIYRMRNFPLIALKRGVRKIWRKVKYTFVKPKMRQCILRHDNTT